MQKSEFYYRYGDISADGGVYGVKIKDSGWVYFTRVRELSGGVILYHSSFKVAELVYQNIEDIENFAEED